MTCENTVDTTNSARIISVTAAPVSTGRNQVKDRRYPSKPTPSPRQSPTTASWACSAKAAAAGSISPSRHRAWACRPTGWPSRCSRRRSARTPTGARLQAQNRPCPTCLARRAHRPLGAGRLVGEMALRMRAHRQHLPPRGSFSPWAMRMGMNFLADSRHAALGGARYDDQTTRNHPTRCCRRGIPRTRTGIRGLDRRCLPGPRWPLARNRQFLSVRLSRMSYAR